MQSPPVPYKALWRAGCWIVDLGALPPPLLATCNNNQRGTRGYLRLGLALVTTNLTQEVSEAAFCQDIFVQVIREFDPIVARVCFLSQSFRAPWLETR